MGNQTKLEQLKKIIRESQNLVCIAGNAMPVENGYPMMQESDWVYEMEMKYGDSPEEIFSSSVYATKTEKFFQFYREEILSNDFEPNDSYKALLQLEKNGYLKSIITAEIYSLAKRAGCKNVIELYGNIYNNTCPHCKKEYDISVIKNSAKVPICTKCNRTIRPGVFLYGEMIDNQVMTRAMEEISKADTLLICGSNLTSPNVISCLQYFKGDRIVIINDKAHFSDERAYLTITDKVLNVLPAIAFEQ